MTGASLEQKLAWRNVWRNPRRTALTIGATVFATALVVFFVALAAGVHGQMIEDSVRIHSGHVTLSAPGYLDSRTLDHFVELDTALRATLDASPEAAAWTPRVTSFALLSKTEASRGVVLMGVDPEREGGVSTLPERVRAGRFLSADRPGEIVLGQRLADLLGAELGDEILAVGSAYTLESAYELFELAGVVKLPDPDLERSLAVIRIEDASAFLEYGDRVSEIAVLARSPESTEQLRGDLQSHLPGKGEGAVRVHTWQEVMPELDQMLFLDDAGMVMMLAILVIVVGFGILNTILMAVLERQRELGVMLAVGLRPRAIFRVVYWESIMLAAVGVVIGILVALPLAFYLQFNPIRLEGSVEGAYELVGAEPIITAEVNLTNPLYTAGIIGTVAMLAALYPALRASRSRPVDALRST